MSSLRYENVVVSGKFRLLHIGHRELLIRAIGLGNHVSVVICNGNFTRYSSINQLKIAISKIFQSLNFSNYTIHVTNNMEEGEEWDRELLRLVPNLDVILNTKEDYKNILIKNLFVECSTPLTVSVSAIETDFYNSCHLVAKEFQPFLNKKVVITGIESCGKTTLSSKLASYYSTTFSEEYGRFYSSDYLGGNEECFTPSDFVMIAMRQTLQDEEKNLQASNVLIVDSDPIVTLYYLRLYARDKMMDINNDEYVSAENFLKTLIFNYRDKVDLVLYMEPKVPYVRDGQRWNEDKEVRTKLNDELKTMYRGFGVDFVTIDSSDYDDRFHDAVDKINLIFK